VNVSLRIHAISGADPLASVAIWTRRQSASATTATEATDTNGAALPGLSLTLLYRHRQQFGALVAALMTHRVVNPAEILYIWQRGTFAFRGHIGEIPRCVTGPEDLDDPAYRRILRQRFGCTFGSPGPQDHAPADGRSAG
jgi:hypothetical protein